MKKRIAFLLKTYLLFVTLFVVQKPLFMLYYHSLYEEVEWGEWFRVMLHGLPLDFSLAGYFTVLPGLLLIVSVWTVSGALHRLLRGYYGIVSLLVAVAFVVDLGLYRYWGFRLDATPLFYFFSSPKDALASVTGGMVAGGLLAVLLYTVVLYALFHVVLLRKGLWSHFKLPYKGVGVSALLLLLTALLFIPIRGGFSASTMNVGKVFYSNNQRVNHAAINPLFSLMESLSRQTDFAAQYRFMEPAEADKLFADLTDSRQGEPSIQLFNTKRPDFLFVILESFSSKLMTELGGEPDVAINLDSLAREGVLFTNFYANSFRTDRGLVSILSGYPAQPTTSLMKYPRKIQTVPSLPAKLKQEGYALKYYYGGDADFTNMRSYLVSSGFEEIVSEDDFPLSQRLSKWGAHDELLFNKLLDDLQTEAAAQQADSMQPRFRVLQTSSSHEPFDVPYHRLSHKALNAFAYTDSCMGDFMRRFRKLPQWENTVVVLLPDHLGCYPDDIQNYTVERYQIPLLLVGGAVNSPGRIDVIGSQHDLAATLLAQLGLPYEEFTFSKDLLNPASPHFAFFTVPDAFGMVTKENRLIFECQSNSVVLDEGEEPGVNLQRGKAYLQKIFDDIAKR